MRLNIVYCGPVDTANERRDFMLMLKYGLEAAGHSVLLSFCSWEPDCLNIIFGSHNLSAPAIEKLADANIRYAIINTETIDEGMLNYRPDKCKASFEAWLTLLQRAEFIWDTIPQNLAQYTKYQLEAEFLRWGYCPELEEIKHDKPKDLDFYFFGVMTDYRKEIINSLYTAGFKGAHHEGVPYFVRNTFIERSKVCLNLIQDPKFTHVNNFRICYLANNSVCTLAQVDNNTSDMAGYLKYSWTFTKQSILEELEISIGLGRAHKIHGRLFGECFKMLTAKNILAELLEQSL